MADYILPVAAAKVRAARSNFAFLQGKKSNQVYISAQSIGAPQIASLNAECGEPKQLFKGVCFLENEQMVFAVKMKPSMVWQTLIEKVFKEKKAAKYLPILLRQLGENESDVVSGPEGEDAAATPARPTATEEPAAPTAPGAVDEEGEWRKMKADVTPRVSAAIKANPENRQEILGLLSQALEKEKAGQFADARTIFFQLIGRLPSPEAEGTPKPPPSPPTAPPPGGKVLSASELSLAMQKIVPRLQEAMAAHPARRAEILAPAAKFKAALNGGKPADAQAAMMEALALLKTLAPAAPGSTVPPPPPPPPTPPPGPAAAADADAAEDDEPVDEEEVAFNEAEEKAFTTTWDKASKVWLDCVETVDGQIEKVRSAMQNSGDEDFEAIADRGLTALTDNHKTPVMVALRDVKSARGDARGAAAKKARKAIVDFRSHVLSDERIAICDEECEAEFGVKLTIRDEISRGLDELENALETIPAL